MMPGVRLARVHEGTFPLEVRGNVRDAQTLQRHAPRCTLPSLFFFFAHLVHAVCIYPWDPGAAACALPPGAVAFNPPPELKPPPRSCCISPQLAPGAAPRRGRARFPTAAACGRAPGQPLPRVCAPVRGRAAPPEAVPCPPVPRGQPPRFPPAPERG